MARVVFLAALASGSVQQLKLSRADPCVRLLTRQGEHGCATPAAGVVAPLHPLLRLDQMSALPSSGPVALALPSSEFDLRTMHAVHSSLGSRLLAVLVLSGDEMPLASPQPEVEELSPAERTYSLPSHVWNRNGSALSRSRFPFGIALLDDNETASLQAILHQENTSSIRPLLQMHYPMAAHGDSQSCLAAGTCLPLGGQSLWGSLLPRSVNARVPRPDQPVALLTSTLDGAAFFHQHVPAADAAMSGAVALLAAVDAIVSSPRLRRFNKQVVSGIGGSS